MPGKGTGRGKEKPIFPSGWPNPVGPPTIEGTRDLTRIGGKSKLKPSNKFCFDSREPGSFQ